MNHAPKIPDDQEPQDSSHTCWRDRDKGCSRCAVVHRQDIRGVFQGSLPLHWRTGWSRMYKWIPTYLWPASPVLTCSFSTARDYPGAPAQPHVCNLSCATDLLQTSPLPSELPLAQAPQVSCAWTVTTNENRFLKYKMLQVYYCHLLDSTEYFNFII